VFRLIESTIRFRHSLPGRGGRRPSRPPASWRSV